MASKIRKAQQGDQEAFVSLVEENKQMLYKIALSYLHREEDVADALQNTFLFAFEHMKDLRSEKYFRTWLVRILINQCKDILKVQKRIQLVEQVPEQAYFDDGIKKAEFLHLLEQLPEKYRMVFVLFYGEGLRLTEVAEILDMDENTVKTRLRRGREYLRENLQP